MSSPISSFDFELFLFREFSDYKLIPASNEFETQFLLHSEANIKDVKRRMINWIKDTTANSLPRSVELSTKLRENGNSVFRENKKENALKAAQCYTEAIFAAPDGSTALPLAHANRSAALSEFGYYKEAYEDSEFAIEYGYPEKNLAKIRMRQAFCASKLKDYEKLKFCLEKLDKLELSDEFVKQRAEFDKDLIEIKESNFDNKQSSKNECVTQTIINSSRGSRYMTASEDIDKGQIVLVEKSFSIAPLYGCKMCYNCATERFVPFPCNICLKVMYCSLKCKKEHYMVHRFECYAYKNNLFEKLKFAFPLNTVINGLPSIMPYLRECTSAKDIWEKIEGLAKSAEDGYFEVISSKSDFKEFPMHAKVALSVYSGLLTYYLMDFTSFFTLFEGCACGTFDWSVVLSALFLRHSSQMKTNIFSGSIMIGKDSSCIFNALCKIWEKPQHLKKGFLHCYSQEVRIYYGAFPKTSTCTPSCKPSMAVKFDKDYFIGIARYKIQKGEKIYRLGGAEYRREAKENRQSLHQLVSNSNCSCESCTQGDSEFLNLHRYRCQNTSCGKIFKPETSKLRWYKNSNNRCRYLICPMCKTKLSLNWYWEAIDLSYDRSKIMMIFQLFKYSDLVLVEANEVHCYLASFIVKLVYQFWERGVPISNAEFKELGLVIKYWLYAVEIIYDIESIEYVSAVTYALDLMAQDKYTDFDLVKIRSSFCMLTEDLKVVFDNYIKEYIKVKF